MRGLLRPTSGTVMGAVKFCAIFLLLGVVVLLFLTLSPLHSTTSTTTKRALVCIQQLQLLSKSDLDVHSAMPDCRTLLEYAKKSVEDEDKIKSDSNGEEEDVVQDCYENLDVSKLRTYPLDDLQEVRKNYLKSFTKCGHKPVPKSQRLVTVKDDDLPVPNVVHYVWFYDTPSPGNFTFLQYLSLFSVDKNVKPQYILWHGNIIPQGYWWDKATTDIPNIYFVPWDPPLEIFGRRLTKTFFRVDVVRLWIEIVHGGMYLDADTLVLQPLTPLRKHDLTMGRELRFTFASGVLLARPWSMYLRMMLDFYRAFDPRIWPKTLMMEPNRLATLYPHLVHIEEKSLSYPSWADVNKLYAGTFDWSKNYIVHILREEQFGHLLPNNTRQLDQADYTLGAIMRHIYYGDRKLRG